MKFRLTIHPTIDTGPKAYTTMRFETKKELTAASYATSSLLLFLQDQLKAMKDESNMFIEEELVDGEWEEIV